MAVRLRLLRKRLLERSGAAPWAHTLSRASPSGCYSSAGWPFISCYSFREVQLAESISNLPPPVPDGIVPEDVVARTEKRWLMIMLALLAAMMAVIVVTAIMGALHPASNVEVIDPTTLHLQGEFVESNLGTAVEPDGSVTVRIIAEQYEFVPRCLEVPVATAVKFRITSADVVHGFLLPDTNVNTMVVPGFVAEVRTRFSKVGEYVMPCHEFCGLGHHGMWAHVRVVAREQFGKSLDRVTCATQ
jgi:cytochrome c oxidase subunit II